MHPAASVVALVFASLLLGGCIAVDNDRHTIGRSVPIEAIETPPSRGGLPDDGPSLAGLDRSQWQRTEYLVPVDGTYHAPNYAFNPLTRNDTDRQRGILPSPVGALELGSPEGGQVGEAIAGPFVAAADLVVLVPRMFFEWPWVAVESPSKWPYQRSRTESAPSDALDQARP